MRIRLPLLSSLFVLLASCRACEDPPAPKFDAASPGAPDAALPAIRGIDAEPLPSLPAPLTDASTANPSFGCRCKVLYGPTELPFRGPATLDIHDGHLRVLANDNGKPRTDSAPTGPATSFSTMRWPPCEIAGKFAYCQGPGGTIYRTTIGGNDTKRVASSRPGTRIAAAALGDGHSVVAFLQSHKTTEGDMLQAFAVVDEGEAARLSEDGAGATTLRVIERGAGALAIYVDTRTAMVPVHARPLKLEGNGLALGTDTVVFVGGAPERGLDFAVSAQGNDVFALVPMPKDTTEFGMAALPIHDPPKMDVAAVWSLYPNGLDPAPIGAEKGWVARLSPRERAPGSPRGIELGRLGKDGAFTSHGMIATGKAVTDISVAVEPNGAVWIAYGDTNATWLEKRACP